MREPCVPNRSPRLLPEVPRVVLFAVFAVFSTIGPAGADAYEMAPLALTGDAVADRSGVFFERFDVAPAINDSRTVAFVGDLTSGGEGVFRHAGGTSTTIALQGETAPTTFAGYCFFDYAPAINASGAIAFPASFGLPNCSQLFGVGLFAVDAQATRLITTSETAPDTGGEEFCTFEQQPAIDDDGDVAFLARYEDCISFLLTGASSGMFVLSGDTVSSLALPGGLAPGTSGAFSALEESPARNESGDLAFVAEVLTLVGEEPDVEEQIDRGVFLQTTGGVQKIAFPGDASGNAGIFSDFDDTGVAINASAHVAFNAAVDGTPGVFVATGGAPQAIVLAGDAVPGSASDVFAAFPTPPRLNDAGKVVFLASYGPPGAEPGALATGLFDWSAGALGAVALAGEPAAGVAGATFAGFPVAPGLNGLGDLAFSAHLSGAAVPAQGLFLARVPEPATTAAHLATLVCLTLAARRRPRA